MFLIPFPNLIVYLAAWERGDNTTVRRRKANQSQQSTREAPNIEAGEGRNKNTDIAKGHNKSTHTTDSNTDPSATENASLSDVELLDLERFRGDGDLLGDLEIDDKLTLTPEDVYAGNQSREGAKERAWRSIHEERLIELHLNGDDEGISIFVYLSYYTDAFINC